MRIENDFKHIQCTYDKYFYLRTKTGFRLFCNGAIKDFPTLSELQQYIKQQKIDNGKTYPRHIICRK